MCKSGSQLLSVQVFILCTFFMACLQSFSGAWQWVDPLASHPLLCSGFWGSRSSVTPCTSPTSEANTVSCSSVAMRGTPPTKTSVPCGGCAMGSSALHRGMLQ